jgi:para-nitrobenzyl esterase
MIQIDGRGSALAMILAAALGAGEAMADQVRTKDGVLEGTTEPGLRVFRGIPYGAPPLGDLRWREPQPVAPWKDVRKATDFGARCMQGPIFDDMVFRDQPSEDCLYLNVWTPARSAGEKLAVMFWIHGGGFQAGSASEPRQDGARLAGKGVVVVSLNYRLGVFGFLAHPELTKESGRGASGNYGLLDQVAALRWVRDNVAAFGGDPGNVTIFGESAGSFAVSALMASPLARGLFQRAIGESGAYLGPSTGLELSSLAAEEAKGSRWAASIGAGSLSALRGKTADEILQPALEVRPEFNPTVDGYVLPRHPEALYAAGEQAHVPLLAGWNADESRAEVVLARTKPTATSFVAQIHLEFGPAADSVLAAYPAASDAEALARTGDPNGPGLPTWPPHKGTQGQPVMHLDVVSHAAPDALKPRYEALDAALSAPAPLPPAR